MAVLPLVLISAISNAVLNVHAPALYHEFNCFESPEKTTETTSTFADSQGFKKEN